MTYQPVRSQRLRCLIVEDEPIAQDLLIDLVEQHPDLELMGAASNAVEALELFLTIKPDLLLLDIHLPGISGLDLLRSLATYKPFVILTTAFQNYALEGFELNVVDYLLKPISYERLCRAVSKVLERIGQIGETNIVLPTEKVTGLYEAKSGAQIEDETCLTVKDGRSLVKIPFNDILLCEAMDDYVKIFTANRFIMTLSSLSRLEESLPKALFSRVSRSYIVRHQAIRRIDSHSIELSNGRQLSVGRSKYKTNLKALVQLLM